MHAQWLDVGLGPGSAGHRSLQLQVGRCRRDGPARPMARRRAPGPLPAPAPQAKGLSNSKWAEDPDEVVHKNKFTGYSTSSRRG